MNNNSFIEYRKILNISIPEYKPPQLNNTNSPPKISPPNMSPPKNKVKGKFQVQPLNLSKTGNMSMIIGLKDIRTI